MAENKKKEKLPRKDQDFRDLCEWLEVNIFNYHVPYQRLQTDACLVLTGLQKGKAMANNNIEDNGFYPFNVILMTFKANKILIQNAIKGKTFNSERQKMSYVCAIVRDKLNDMYSRYLNAQKAKEQAENFDTSVAEYQGAEYKRKESKETKQKEDKFKELW